MSNNRTTVIIVGAVIVMCMCVAIISVAAGGYFVLNQSGPVLVATRAVSAPNNVPPLPTLSSLPNPPSVPTPAVSASCDDVEEFDDQGYDHIRPNEPHPPYNSNPPTSGWHWAQPQEWGIYSTPQVQEQLVHNLEHGGIVIQYNNLSSAELARLLDFVKRNPRHIIVAPYPGLPGNAKIAWTAWTYLQACDGVDLEALADFIDEFRDQGPETVP